MRDFYLALPRHLDFCLTFLGQVYSIYGFNLVRHCGSRTAGEVLFCYSPKKYPKKAATTTTPLQKNTGVPIDSVPSSCCEKTRR